MRSERASAHELSKTHVKRNMVSLTEHRARCYIKCSRQMSQVSRNRFHVSYARQWVIQLQTVQPFELVCHPWCALIVLRLATPITFALRKVSVHIAQNMDTLSKLVGPLERHTVAVVVEAAPVGMVEVTFPLSSGRSLLVEASSTTQVRSSGNTTIPL
jgi:hypothetical protein